MELSTDAINFIRQRYDELGRRKGYTTQIITEVREKFQISISHSTIRYYCVTKIDKLIEKIDEVNAVIKEEEPYEFANDRYIVGEFSFTREEMDEIFRSYSKFGKNMTGDEMIKDFGFLPEQWNSLKRAMRLFKTSHVISPETAKTLTPLELDRVVEEAIGESHDRIKAKMVNTHTRMEAAELKRYRKMFGNWEFQLAELRRFIEGHKPIKIDFAPVELKNNDSRMFVISDIHLGKIDTAGVVRRLDQVYQNIVSCNESIVHITILGDLVETFVPDGMHSGQISYGIEQEFGVGFTAMLKIAHIFEKFFIGLAKAGKQVHVKGITGNHGRMTQQKEHDPERTGELVVYELIKRALENMEIDIKYYRDLIVSFDYEDMGVIMHHGDNLDSMVPEKLIVSHGQIGKYNVILSGDRHNIRFNEGKNFSNVRCPALAGQGVYDKKLNLYSEPGYLEIKQNPYKTADISVRRLK